MDKEELKDLARLGVGVAIATCDENHCPDLTDGMGMVLSEDCSTLRLFISSQESNLALLNLQKNPLIAVSFSRPCDNFAAQIKGKVFKVSEISEDDLTKVKEWEQKYRCEIELVGVHPEAAQALVLIPDMMIEVKVTELFTQTPGAKAGSEIGKI